MTTAVLADDAVTPGKIANVTRIITVNIMGWNSETLLAPGMGVRTMPTGVTAATYSFALPYDYAGGDVTIREWYQIHDSGGTAKIARTIQKVTAGNVQTTIEFQGAYDLSGTGGDTFRTNVISGSSVAAGDLLWVTMQREGDDVADTMGRLDVKVIAIEYVASQ